MLKSQYPAALCVVTTIFDDAEHLLSALRAGADGYLLKDETEDEFIRQLAGILEGRPPLSASIARALLAQFQPGKQEQEATLTQRETEILTFTAKGLSVKHAAELLGISYYTAAGYLKDVYRKLQVNSRAEATIKAMNLGLINLD
jgi:DNA-binding NarL/FixJ family response regulator